MKVEVKRVWIDTVEISNNPAKCRDCGEEMYLGKNEKDRWVAVNMDKETCHWDTCKEKKPWPPKEEAKPAPKQTDIPW